MEASSNTMLHIPDFMDYGYGTKPESQLVTPQMKPQRVSPPELFNDLVCFCEDLCQEDCFYLHNSLASLFVHAVIVLI